MIPRSNYIQEMEKGSLLIKRRELNFPFFFEENITLLISHGDCFLAKQFYFVIKEGIFFFPFFFVEQRIFGISG